MGLRLGGRTFQVLGIDRLALSKDCVVRNDVRGGDSDRKASVL